MTKRCIVRDTETKTDDIKVWNHRAERPETDHAKSHAAPSEGWSEPDSDDWMRDDSWHAPVPETLTIPNFRDPDSVSIRRVLCNEVTQAAWHARYAIQQDRNQYVALRSHETNAAGVMWSIQQPNAN